MEEVVMKREWIIADTHFGHSNIIKYENRPYLDVDEMNQNLIRSWNNSVKKDDIIYHLGDVSFKNKECTKGVVSKLNGIKTLIMGNHDYQTAPPRWWRECFDFVINGSLLIKEFIILSHKPIYLSENVPFVNIHGHTHGDKTYLPTNKRFCSSVEMIGYKPILLSDIIKHFKI